MNVNNYIRKLAKNKVNNPIESASKFELLGMFESH